MKIGYALNNTLMLVKIFGHSDVFQLDGVVIWEGNRTEVDAFEFADGVSVM